MAAWQLTKALWTSDVEGLERFDVTQPRFNAVNGPAEYIDVCADQDLAVCPYCPLEQGFLTGKYSRDGDHPEGSRGDLYDMEFPDGHWEVLDVVETVADELDATPAQVSLRWLIERDRFTCVPIIGARTPDQIAENVGAVDIELSDDQRERITDARNA
jgi:aryl-alcohol dehydrogenase-like predicted oxidoreductase